MWYHKVVEDMGNIPDFLDYYEHELLQAKKECGIYGNIEKNLSMLPGITETRFSQLQEIEAVLQYINIQYKKTYKKHFQAYLEHYQRALSSRDVEKYVEGEPEVIDMKILENEIALLRNKYLGILKGLEAKSFNLGHITRLRCAGLDEASIN
jgi:hypothetical protein